MPAGKDWLCTEIIKLKKLFPNASAEELQRAFPGRSHNALSCKAHELGLHRPYKRKSISDVALDQKIRRLSQTIAAARRRIKNYQRKKKRLLKMREQRVHTERKKAALVPYAGHEDRAGV